MPSDDTLSPETRLRVARRLSPVLKVFALVLVFVLPLAVLIFILKPIFLIQAHSSRAVSLPKTFSQDELAKFLGQLASETEFKFYFSVFEREGFEAALQDIYPLLKGSSGKETMRQMLLKGQSRVERMARDLETMDFPPQFAAQPLATPQLAYAVLDFVYEEFKLTLMAVAYQALHDPGFFLFWNQDAQRAAHRVRGIVESMGHAERVELEQVFLKSRR